MCACPDNTNSQNNFQTTLYPPKRKCYAHTLPSLRQPARRREILENLGFKVIRIPADIDETPHSDENAADYVQRMAQEKMPPLSSNGLPPTTRSPISDSDRRHYGRLSKPHSRQTGNRSPSSRNARPAFGADASGADCRMRILARGRHAAFCKQAMYVSKPCLPTKYPPISEAANRWTKRARMAFRVWAACLSSICKAASPA